MACQILDVVGALAQRRQPHRHDVEPVVQILAKQPLGNELAQVAVRRGDDAHVGLERRAPADGHVLALLQHPQQPGLGLHRHVADLVEKQGSALGLLEAAGKALGGAGKGTLFVAEQLRFDEFARDGGHVDGDERPFRRRPKSCSARATSSLPVPDSPLIITVRSVWVSRAMMRKMSCMAGERPMIGSGSAALLAATAAAGRWLCSTALAASPAVH
jgi:hypothetical protein